MSVPTWGYRKGESRIFELGPGQPLPKGWYDSPAKIPAGGEPAGEGGGPAVAGSHPPPTAPPPQPGIDEQERTEHQRVLAENEQLKAYVADLEALLETVEPPAQPPVSAQAAQPGVDLPPPPGEQPTIGEILAGVPEDGEPERPMTPIEKARAAKAAKREREKDGS